MTTIAALSHQEERILRLKARGLTASEMAGLMGTAEKTIKNQLTTIYSKLGVTNGIEAIFAVGWISIPDEFEPALAQCQFVGQCGRPFEHRGQHGGFRPVK